MNTWLNLKDNVIIVTGGARELGWPLSMNYYHKVLMSR
jgi:NAD(P)-dependent dehydrogenase (short-subunit alcohol dehydrogenase family)